MGTKLSVERPGRITWRAVKASKHTQPQYLVIQDTPSARVIARVYDADDARLIAGLPDLIRASKALDGEALTRVFKTLGLGFSETKPPETPCLKGPGSTHTLGLNSDTKLCIGADQELLPEI